MKTMTQPLKWHGGKFYLAEWIIGHFPPHVHYVEPYFGGGSVLLQKPAEWIEGHSEVVNDIDKQLTNFWQECKGEQFQWAVDNVPFSQVVWKSAYALSKALGDEIPEREFSHPCNRLFAAINFFIRYRQSRQGLGKDFATLSRNRTRRGMNEQASSWLTAIEGLPEIHERLKRVVILCDDALKVIRQQDGPNTLFYLDPPYLPDTRASTGEYGEHEMSFEDHEELLSTLAGIEGKFLLSGYGSGLYDLQASDSGWFCREKVIDCKASSKKEKEDRTECLWMNFESQIDR